MSLDWQANSEPDIAGYRVHYGAASGVYTETLQLGNVTSATVSNLPTGTHYFVVSAFNTLGLESVASGEVSFTTSGTNALPSVSIGVDGGAGALNLIWQVNSEPDVIGYRLYYGTTIGGPYPTMVDVGDVTSTTVSLADGTEYYLVVTAYNALGLESSPSEEIAYGGASSYFAPASFALSATATDSDGSIDRVEFFEGGNMLGQDSSAPYDFDWSGVGVGTYTLFARAYDDDGDFADSEPFVVTVNAGGIENWRQVTFGGGAGDPQVAGDLADPDGDNWSNLAEYVMGGDPLSADGFSATTIRQSETEVSFEFERIANLPDVVLVVESCPWLGGDWSPLATRQAGGVWVPNVAGVGVSELDKGDQREVFVSKPNAGDFELMRVTLRLPEP